MSRVRHRKSNVLLSYDKQTVIIATPINTHNITMNDKPRSPYFWYGNAVLAIALLVLLKLDTASHYLGFGAMVLWLALVVVGVWLLMGDKGKPPSHPD